MSWVSDYQYPWYEKLAVNVMRCGRIPRHIAFIMDGNRRFAKSEHIAKIDGHSKGFEKLAECLRWCLDVGIKEVTTFAFSIENFKRTEDEVSGLLNLAKEKFEKLLSEEDKLKEHGVRIRVIGNITLLPLELQTLISKAVLCTEENDKLFLNIAFSYTSHDEMTQAIETVLKYGSDILEVEDIDENLLGECMYMYDRQSPAPDLLFRTSGENRISDFLMWQLSTTVLYFTRILWPQITIWNFLGGIFAYQRASSQMHYLKSPTEEQQLIKTNSLFTDRVQSFLHRLDMYRRRFLLQLTNSDK